MARGSPLSDPRTEFLVLGGEAKLKKKKKNLRGIKFQSKKEMAILPMIKMINLLHI